MAAADGTRWNHNIHNYPLVLAAVPEHCRRALDVGCGEGMLARSRSPADLARDAAAVVAGRSLRIVRHRWESPAPVIWPPPHSYREIRELARRELPGVRYRRHLLWRYSLTWIKPG